MAANIEQELIEKVRALPPDKQKEALTLLDRLATRSALEMSDLAQQAPRKMTILEKISERSKQVPDEVWERIPPDGAEQHDHYLYGAPKK